MFSLLKKANNFPIRNIKMALENFSVSLKLPLPNKFVKNKRMQNKIIA